MRIYTEHGGLLAAGGHLGISPEDAFEAVEQLDYETAPQPGGGAQKRCILGLHGDGKWRFKAPLKAAATILKIAAGVEAGLLKQAPGWAEIQLQKAIELPDEVRLRSGIFTTVVVNKNAQAGPHTDDGYEEKTFGAVFYLRRNVRGGALRFPDENIAISPKNRDWWAFDGRRHKHEVTPWARDRAQGPEPTRYSMVFHIRRRTR